MTERVRLDVAVLRAGLADSRTRAAALIAAGLIEVDGRVARRPSTPVGAVDITLVTGAATSWASRGGDKLAGALAAWPDLVVEQRRCLDAGASHGGFTDVLLGNGARTVYAVDVGSGQLRPELAADGRVVVLDRRNIRFLRPEDIDGPCDLTVGDLSFISLTVALPALIECTSPDGDLVPMVKPQFEVGRQRLGHGGVVRSDADRITAVLAVAQAAHALGWGTHDVRASTRPGPAGNVEFFLWLRTDAPPPDASRVARAVAAAVPDGEAERARTSGGAASVPPGRASSVRE